MKKTKRTAALILALVIAFSVLLPLNSSAAGEKTVITVDGNSEGRRISDNMFGIFLEDINFAIDGGLGSNLVRNNSFEQRLAWDLNWDCRMTGWETVSGAGGLRGDSPMNKNNPSYFHADEETVLVNHGYPDSGEKFGFYLEKGKKYDFSLYLRGKGTVRADFVSEDGKSFYDAVFNSFDQKEFVRLNCEAVPGSTGYTDLVLTVGAGMDIDFVQLIPKDSFGYGDSTWKYASLRADLVKALKDLSPSFMRFPGGCL
ncbi:MAG: hypothetical protein IKS04_04905, partial [Clostridia bacterium]|nr:hypothetical protein [Clostridia bacterium]